MYFKNFLDGNFLRLVCVHNQRCLSHPKVKILIFMYQINFHEIITYLWP